MTDKNSSESRLQKVKPLLSAKPGRVMPALNDDTQDDEDEINLARTDNVAKVKYLPPSVIKDIEQKNVARKLAGLPPILTRIRLCLTCGAKFQSAGNRTCGCTSRIAGIIAGREII